MAYFDQDILEEIVEAVVARMVRPLARRARGIVLRGVLRLVDDSLKGQTLQVEVAKGHAVPDVERFEQYGFTSFPDLGAECIVLNVGGDADHPVCITVNDRRKRPHGGQAPDTMQWDARGQKVHLTQGPDGRNRIVIETDGVVELKAPEVLAGDGATDALTRWPALEAWITELVSTGLSSGTADLVSGKVTFTALPAAPSAGTEKVKGK